MSLVALKRRAEATIHTRSSNDSFTHQGNHRNQGAVGSDRLPLMSRMEIPCSPEDSSVFKTHSYTNSGMLSARLRGHTNVVQNPTFNNSHQDYLTHCVNKRLAHCPDPAEKVALPSSCDPDFLGGQCSRGRFVETYHRGSRVVPDMPGKSHQISYMERLRQKHACSHEYDDYALDTRGWGQCRTNVA